MESDEEKSCEKSVKVDAFFSETYNASNAPDQTVVWSLREVGKKFYFCGIETHCKDGMVGMIKVLEVGVPPNSKSASTSTMPSPSSPSSTASEASATKKSAANINKPLSVVVIGGVM